jgi:cytochrome c oxidase subunit 2
MTTKQFVVVRCVLTVPLLLMVSITNSASSHQAAAQDGPRVIEIVATRYAFEPAEVEVTEGDAVRLMVRSGDGLHGIEIKQFRVKKEIPRGADPIAIEFTADRAGRYPILCSEYCGEGHGDMKGALVVVARDGGAAR